MYVVMYCEQNAGQNYSIERANKTPGNVAKFKYLSTTNKLKLLA